MTKQEQIEEMGKVMPEKIKDPLDNSRYIIFGKSLRREIARIYYNAGYRKLPEDSVVLSKGAYESLSSKAKANVVNAIEIRKETAEKIFVEVLDLEELKVIRDMGWETIYNTLYNEILELAKQFGVEIKE